MANASPHFDEIVERLKKLNDDLVSIQKDIKVQKKLAIKESPDTWSESNAENDSYGDVQEAYPDLDYAIKDIRDTTSDIWNGALGWNYSSLSC